VAGNGGGRLSYLFEGRKYEALELCWFFRGMGGTRRGHEEARVVGGQNYRGHLLNRRFRGGGVEGCIMDTANTFHPAKNLFSKIKF